MNADGAYVRDRVGELLSRLLGRESAPVPAMPESALDRLTNTCALSAADCDLLLLLAGLAIDASIAPELGLDGCCHGAATLAQLADRIPDAQWSALAPTAPLRRLHLVELTSERILDGWARIDERTLLGILGVYTLDPLLDALADPVNPVDATAESPRRLAAVERVLDVWRGWDGEGSVPVVLISGADATAIAVDAARQAGFQALAFRAASLPTGPREQAEVAALLERESALGPIAAILTMTDIAAEGAAWNIARRCQVPLLIAARSLPAVLDLQGRVIVHVELPTETVAERTEVWRRELGSSLAAQCNGATEVVAHRFILGEAQIQTAAAEVRSTWNDNDAEPTRILWRAARRQARPDLDELATRVSTTAEWDSLILPTAQKVMLRELIAHVRHAHLVQDQWGFARSGACGPGVTAMFHGPSGVGKTLAARVVAGELDLDLYRVDLAQTVSKYIGETEKNLARIFDAADAGAAILVFDEADAIFGKRSEVKNANDRFANIEVAYLLQRLESYRGLAILTTNLPDNLDPAFTRRLRTSIAFPFPDVAAREQMWSHAFPAAAPTANLDIDALARLSVSGGSIANIALGAAVLAADAGTSITMDNILGAAQSEYAKLHRTFGAAELNGWATQQVSNTEPRRAG